MRKVPPATRTIPGCSCAPESFASVEPATMSSTQTSHHKGRAEEPTERSNDRLGLQKSLAGVYGPKNHILKLSHIKHRICLHDNRQASGDYHFTESRGCHRAARKICAQTWRVMRQAPEASALFCTEPASVPEFFAMRKSACAYRSVIVMPLRSRLIIRPTCAPVRRSVTPLALRSVIARTPPAAAAPAPIAV